jgi:hypothetical protein
MAHLWAWIRGITVIDPLISKCLFKLKSKLRGTPEQQALEKIKIFLNIILHGIYVFIAHPKVIVFCDASNFEPEVKMHRPYFMLFMPIRIMI